MLEYTRRNSRCFQNIIPFAALSIALAIGSCSADDDLAVKVFQTSAAGDKLTEIKPAAESFTAVIEVLPQERFQQIQGIGGAFTESSAYLLNQLSPANREDILQAYFGDDGARYSLTRTHMNSCDFSLGHYSYAPIAGDTGLSHFSIEPDREDIIPMIREARQISQDGFEIIASPWTAPPWMKTNQDWYGGSLDTAYYDVWARFFLKYLEAYRQEGIEIWAFTVENEPLGNDSHWESMHYTPEEMADFVKNHLGPLLEKEEVKILVYDQNRGEELEEWARVLLTDTALLPYIDGTAVHWYTSTVDWFPESLQYTHELAPSKSIIHTEGCVDAEVPHWQDDAWYWRAEATDWGYEWAEEEDKFRHPKYVPAYRYARDIIGCFNNWVEGWIDWNMVLDRQGGPNLAQNWCVAPVIVDPAKDSVYYTPLYHVIGQFSRFIRPGATRIGYTNDNSDLLLTAVENTDGSRVVVLLNQTEEAVSFQLSCEGKSRNLTIQPQTIQSIIL